MKHIITGYLIVCGVLFMITGKVELAAIYTAAALVILALGNRPNPPRNA